jgi:hypothetical protein
MKASQMYKIYIFFKGLIPKNIKTYLILAAVLFVSGLMATIKIQYNSNVKLKNENTRIEGNQFALLSDDQTQVNLVLKQKEINGKLKFTVDSLAKELKIKVKQIEKVVTIENTIHDTLNVPVPVYITSKNEWLLRDSSACFKYASKLILKGDSIEAIRQYFEYDNKTIEIFYKIRPHKFLFIKYGKWQYKEKISATCGIVQEKEIQFVK